MSDKLREKIAQICWSNEHFKNYSTWEEAVKHNQGSVERSYKCADQILAIIPDIEELKRRIEIKRANAFSVSLFGDRDHQLGMDAMVNAYDVVLNLIKEMTK